VKERFCPAPRLCVLEVNAFLRADIRNRVAKARHGKIIRVSRQRFLAILNHGVDEVSLDARFIHSYVQLPEKADKTNKKKA
jgi:hypothetical protein